MKAGLLRRRLRIERRTVGRDGFLAPTIEPWELVGEVDAQVDAISGREYFGSDRELAGLTWRISLRQIPGLQLEPDMRATDIDSGEVFDFVAILPSHYRDMQTLAAMSGTSQP